MKFVEWKGRQNLLVFISTACTGTGTLGRYAALSSYAEDRIGCPCPLFHWSILGGNNISSFFLGAVVDY